MPKASRTGETNQRLHLLFGLAALLGLGALASSVREILDNHASMPGWSHIGAFTALVIVGELVRVRVRIRSTLHSATWVDAAILVGFAIMPAPWVVVLTAGGIAVAKTLRRLTPTQIVFGTAKEAATAFTGGLVLSLMAGPDAGPGPLAVTFLTMVPVDMLLVIPVIAVASRTRVRDRLRDNLDIRFVALLARLCVALLAVLALELEPQLLYALPLLILILHLWHERWVRAREERQAWQHLASATESFTGMDLDVVLRSAVTEGAKLFSADEIEVEVWLDSRCRLVRGDAGTIRFDGDPAHAPPDRTNVYAVALHGYSGERDIGALRLRFHTGIKICERDQAMLQTYAAALDTAVRNAAAYGRLGEATAAHAHAAAHDPLTGLANRRELERRLITAGDGPGVALLLLDLKHFKQVNDALGSLAGDQVLLQVGQRLTGAAGPDDLVCRFGGDEFAVLLPGAVTEAEAEGRAQRLLAGLAEPITVEGVPLAVEAHAGVALGAGLDVTELMRRADVAMHQSKQTSRSPVCFDAVRDPKDPDQLELSGQLAQAVTRREFVLHFQPIVDLASGVVVAAEALARWRHPTRGLLTPSSFLHLLERSNQLPAFTTAVLHDALAAADLWRAAGHDVTVSVNISARSLLDTNLPGQVRAALAAHRTPPEGLCLELTETLAISQLDTVDRVLCELREIGVRLALDDFGTGYSPLSVLPRVMAGELKIDQSFITTMHADMFPELECDAETMAWARAVVRSTIALGRDLRLTVVAEGIETEVQRHSLWELGCPLGQGHLFARATPAEQLLALLTRGTADRPGALARPLHADANVVPLSRGRPVGETGLGRRT